MGASPSAILNPIVEGQKARAAETQNKIESEMAMMESLLEARANEFYLRLINAEGEDKTVPIKTIIDYKRHVAISVKDEPSEELNGAIEDLFGGKYLSSLKAMCMLAVNAVLTKASAGEKLDIGYKVLILHSAVVRVDYMVYGYTTSAKTGVADVIKNGLVCVATVGMVDFKSIGLEALVYLVGTQCAQAGSFINSRQRLWSKRADELDEKNWVIEKEPEKFSQSLLKVWYENLTSEYGDGAEKDKDASAKIPEEYTMEKPGVVEITKMRNLLRTKIEDTLAEYENIEKNVRKEQQDMLEEMKQLYITAKEVSTVLGSRDIEERRR